MNILQRLLRTAEEIFRVDTRALAILRIGLGVIILCDLVSRVGWLVPFYSDDSFFTRQLSKSCNDPAAWSLYWLSGATWFAQTLFALTALAAVCLVIGFKTRIATLACLILCYSMFVRMPLVLDGGHVLLRMMLFWSVFLPLGDVWSVDSRRKTSPPLKAVSNVATAAIMLQLAMMYFFSGLAKCNADWWHGNAILQAMSLEMYARPLAENVKSLPSWLLLTVGRATLVAEIVGPILIFLPRIYKSMRWLFLGAFCLMHIGIWLTLSIGVFAAVAMLSWVLFIPVGRFSESPSSSDIRSKQSTWHYAGQVLCAFVLPFVFLLNVSNINHPWAKYAFPEAFKSIAWLTMTAQEFKMFGAPPVHNPKLVLEVSDLNGQHSFDLDSASFDSRTAVYESNHATRRLNYNLVFYYELDKVAVVEIRKHWGEYLATLWQARNKQAAIDVSLNCTLEPIGPEAESKSEVWWKSE